MRAVVRAAFVPFTARLEGAIAWMYLDVKGLVTIADGNLIDPCGYAMLLPFVHPDGSPATPGEIGNAWLAVKGRPELAQLGDRAAERVTTLRLTPEGIAKVVLAKLDEVDRDLARRFPAYPTWPAAAQLGTLSLAWACGAAFHFPLLEAALRRLDFHLAAVECAMNTTGNAGLRPRNENDHQLFLEAATVLELGLDPDVLFWPGPAVAPVPDAPAPEDGGTGFDIDIDIGVTADDDEKT